MTLNDSESSDEDVGHANNNIDCDTTFAGARSFSSVMEILGQEINPDQWRLITVSPKVNLKAFLLHNGKKFPSVPLVHEANMKESYESVKLLLGKIKYDEFKWKLCGDLKVVALLFGMQLGYKKYCCFLCEWDSRDKKYHYLNKLWPKRTSLTPGGGMSSIPLLFFGRKFFCHPLYIKLGLMKNFVKGIDKTGRGFEYVRNKFPNVSDSKIKEGIFIGPQIRELMQNKQFDEDMNETERNAWLSFKRICRVFLGNHKSVNYQDVVQDMLTS